MNSHRREEHGEEVDHGLHVEAPFGGQAGCRQEHQAADCGKQHLGNKCTHGEGENLESIAVDGLLMRVFQSSKAFEIF